MASCVTPARDRMVLFLSAPALWPAWPFLPVVRRGKGHEELGVVFDSRSAGLTGFSSTVWLTNLFELPTKFTEFLAMPHETFDSADELVIAGWCID